MSTRRWTRGTLSTRPPRGIRPCRGTAAREYPCIPVRGRWSLVPYGVARDRMVLCGAVECTVSLPVRCTRTAGGNRVGDAGLASLTSALVDAPALVPDRAGHPMLRPIASALLRCFAAVPPLLRAAAPPRSSVLAGRRSACVARRCALSGALQRLQEVWLAHNPISDKTAMRCAAGVRTGV